MIEKDSVSRRTKTGSVPEGYKQCMRNKNRSRRCRRTKAGAGGVGGTKAVARGVGGTKQEQEV
jgi:hypothetical protein